jgi:hypothetical protein
VGTFYNKTKDWQENSSMNFARIAQKSARPDGNWKNYAETDWSYRD